MSTRMRLELLKMIDAEELSIKVFSHDWYNHTQRGFRFGQYLSEKHSPKQVSWCFTPAGMMATLVGVPIRFWRQVIEPEIRRMAEQWNYKLKVYVLRSGAYSVFMWKEGSCC